MAIGIHIARVAFLAVNRNSGQVVDKNNGTSTIKDALQTEHQHRVLPDVTKAPNSGNYPTVDEYLVLEAAANYKLQYMDQNMIVTYAA